MTERSLSERHAALQSKVQTMSNDSLLLIATGEVNMQDAARDELMQRGLGPDGQWHAPDALEREWFKISATEDAEGHRE